MAKVTRRDGPGKAILREAIKDLSAHRAKVGWLESAKYPEGQPVAYVAAIQEFGYPPKGIPPRLGMRATIEQRRAAWRAMAKRGASAVLVGNGTASDMLALVAEQARGDFLRTIAAVQTPPLAQSTISNRARRKASGEVTKTLTKPLIDTGKLFQTMVAVVE